METIFYNSSMPRAGSTLLQNILGQNPDFYTTPTSGVLDLIYTTRNTFSSGIEFKAQEKDIMTNAFYSFCREGMKGYFNSITEKRYILDKSRGWGVHYNLLNEINPNPKIVCMVRDIRDIVASMEKKYRTNPDFFEDKVRHSDMVGTTTGKRVELFLNTLPVGLAIDRVLDILQQNIPVHFIKYEDLVLNPEEVVSNLYAFFNIDSFEHNFNNIDQITFEDDRFFGIYGDHKLINKAVIPPNNNWEAVLSTGSGEYIFNRYKWFFEKFGYKK